MASLTLAADSTDTHGAPRTFEGQLLDVFSEAACKVFFLAFNPIVDALPAGVVRFAFNFNPSHAASRKKVKTIRANIGMVVKWLTLRSG